MGCDTIAGSAFQGMTMHLLETRVPPPLVMLLCGALGYALAGAWPRPVTSDTPWKTRYIQ